MTDNYYNDIQIIRSLQEITKFQPEWEIFIREHTKSSTFRQDPNIIKLYIEYKNLGEPLIIIIRKKGEIECIAPCVIKKNPINLTFSVFKIPGLTTRILRIVDDSVIFSKNTTIQMCTVKIMEALFNYKDLFDIIKLEILEETNPLCKYFELPENKVVFQLKATSPKKEHVWRHYLAETYEDWLNTLGKSTKRLTKRRVKTLYSKFPDQVEFRKITKSADIPDFLKHLNKLYPKTWQAKTFGESKKDSPKDIDFYRKIADLGYLRSYLLLINEQPAAFLIATQYADTFEAQEIGYDAKYSSIGIGSALNYMIIKDLYSDNKPTLLSFGFGDNTYKEILCNDKNPAYEAYITRHNFAGRFIKLQTILNTVEYQIRRYLIKYKLDDKIRKILKKK